MIYSNKEILNIAINHRQNLHQIPELSNKEFKTASYCKEILSKIGYKITNIWQEGFIADLDLNKSKTIAFRADMDALPIIEENNLKYKSKHKGISHACGHDSHMSIMLTLAELIEKNKKNINSNIRFLFQPAEEIYPGGAKFMIENGALNEVDLIFGLHNNPLLEIGVVKCILGNVTASCDTFDINIIGKGGHASSPHTALNPTSIIPIVTNEINLIKQKSLPAFDNSLINVTNIVSNSNLHNVITNNASLQGIIRSFDKKSRKIIINKIKEILSAIEIYGYKTSINIESSYPSIINKEKGYNYLKNAIINTKNIEIDKNNLPEFWGEDFSYYLEKIDGAFLIIGSGNKDKNITNPLHSPKFDIDESYMQIAVKIFFELLK